MPTFQFEAMDATGAEIKDVIEAPTEEEAQATIRQMGYFVTKITAKKARKKADTAGAKKKRGFVFGGVKSRDLLRLFAVHQQQPDWGLAMILGRETNPHRIRRPRHAADGTIEVDRGIPALAELALVKDERLLVGLEPAPRH